MMPTIVEALGRHVCHLFVTIVLLVLFALLNVVVKTCLPKDAGAQQAG